MIDGSLIYDDRGPAAAPVLKPLGCAGSCGSFHPDERLQQHSDRRRHLPTISAEALCTKAHQKPTVPAAVHAPTASDCDFRLGNDILQVDSECACMQVVAAIAEAITGAL